MSDLVGIPNPERYADDSPWATHVWLEDPYWQDSAVWCGYCGAASYKDEAHKPCPGPVPVPCGPPATALLAAPK